eukprot:CAMPEP_0172175774 /NCGR_PEP_ID=MMETSP1050-20130122/14420_1 /TAXON_ID=233186 /ORGANISM="Cryptomonas curvata, Strain CCAP979/52" /LENGTH=224 /DNA_ID=CAMNT_0012847925 /DNA_START=104 /DNA_END=774 /DNA_ORIENTATION=+
MKVDVDISVSSLDRILELHFETCIGCSYRWKLLSNPFTARIKSVGKEIVPTNGPDKTGGSGKTRYLFSAFNPGKADLTFEYGPKSPGPDDTTYRVNVHIAIRKLPTPLPPVLKPVPIPSMPPAKPVPLAPIEAHLSASSEGPPFAMSVGQVINIYLSVCDGCQDDAWSLSDPVIEGILEAAPTPASVPGKTLFSFKAVGLGTGYLFFQQSDGSLLFVLADVEEA